MHLLQFLKTIPLYINYFLAVVDQHSIQAPFAFEFYNELRKALEKSDVIDEIEHARDRFLDDHLLVDGEDMGAGSRVNRTSTISSIAQYGISSKRDCMFLLALANICNPQICIELGSSLGISTAYLAKSGHINSIYSFEGNKALVKSACQLLDELDAQEAQIMQGNIDAELPRLLSKLESVDLAIIDANHTENALLNYFRLLKPKMQSNSIVMIDDIRWSNEMYRGWRKIIGEREVTVSMEFLCRGLIFFKKGIQKQHYVLPY